MARIRSIKPEFWTDRKLARLSRDARLLYVSLWNQADEHGRLHGDTRYVKGHCLPYDDDLSLRDIDALLAELAAAGRVQRYDVEGDPFLYLPKLAQHQRLEAAKVPSRLPVPPGPDDSPPPATSSEPRADKSAPDVDEPAPRAEQSETTVALQVAGSRVQVAGGKEQVAGVPATPGALAPRDDAQALVGEWIERCAERPPRQVIGHLSKQIKALLDEGIDPSHVRRGLVTWQSKGLHPSALPSVVNESMNARPLAMVKPSTTDALVHQTLALAEHLRSQERGA